MFRSVFRYKGGLWHVLNNLTDLIALSFLWALCSMPVLTLGAATTALYDSMVRCVRFGEEGPYRRFFRSFRSELPVSIFSTLLWGAVLFIGFLLLRLLSAVGAESESAAFASYVYVFVLVLPVGSACWVFPILSRFSFTFAGLNITACKFAIAHLPSTAALVFLTYGILYLSINYILMLIAAPGLLMLLWSLFVEPVFSKHGGGLMAAPNTGSAEPDED